MQAIRPPIAQSAAGRLATMAGMNEPRSPSPAQRFRFSLLALFGFVASVALGCAALTNPSEFWNALIGSAALVYLLLAPLGAFFCRNANRAFWAAFAVVAW